MQTLALIITVIIAAILCITLWRKLANTQAQLLEEKTKNIQLTEQKNAFVQRQADLETHWQKITAEQDNKFAALQKQAQDTFKQLAGEVLKTQKEDLTAHNAQNFYNPLKESFERFTKELGTLRTDNATHNTDLKNALERTAQLNENLSKQADELATALKNPKTQGTWGEIILEDVLRSAGLREGIQFDKQVSLKDEDGKRLQPDFIIHLPQNRDMVIDSKMSLNAYVKWAACPEGEEKEKFLKEHLKSVTEHIKELSETNYPRVLKNNKLDFTLMFVPIEHAYFAALQANPALHEEARQKHIYIVTASNVLTILQIAENLWRIEDNTKKINKIFQIAQNMHYRVGTFVERMEKIQNNINTLQTSYNAAKMSLDGKEGILTSARQLEELHVKSAKALPQQNEDFPALPTDNAD